MNKVVPTVRRTKRSPVRSPETGPSRFSIPREGLLGFWDIRNGLIGNIGLLIKEWERSNPVGSVYYIDSAATGSGDGSSWENAYTTIQAALTARTVANTVFEISAGTYNEKITTTANQTLRDSLTAGHSGPVIISGVALAGHTLTVSHTLVLDGNIDVRGADTGNYNCLINLGKVLVGNNLTISNASLGVYNNGTVTLNRSILKNITGAWIIQTRSGKTTSLNFCTLRDNASSYSVQQGTENILNCLFIGSLANPLDIAGNNAQVLNLTNCMFVACGLTDSTSHTITNTSTNAVVNAKNNLVLANPFNPETYNIGITSDDSLYQSPLIMQRRRTGYLSLTFHDIAYYDYWLELAAYAESIGLKTTVILDLSVVTSEMWSGLHSYNQMGHSVGFFAANHVTLTNFTGLSITGPAGSTMDVVIDSTAGVSSAWPGAITLNESGTPGKYSIDLATFTTLAAVATEISTKPGWTASVVESGDGTGLGNKRRGINSKVLASVTGVSTATAYAALVNSIRYWFTELAETKAAIESHGIACNVHHCPGGSTSTDLITWLKSDSHGYWGRAGTTYPLMSAAGNEFGSYTLSGDMQSGNPAAYGFSIYQVRWFLVSDYIGASNIVRNVDTLIEFLGYIGGAVIMRFYNPTAYSVANAKLAMDELVRINANIVSEDAIASFARTGTDANGDGTRWTRTFQDNSDFRLQSTSPCIGAGISPFVNGNGDQYDADGYQVWSDTTNLPDGHWLDGVDIGAYAYGGSDKYYLSLLGSDGARYWPSAPEIIAITGVDNAVYDANGVGKTFATPALALAALATVEDNIKLFVGAKGAVLYSTDMSAQLAKIQRAGY